MEHVGCNKNLLRYKLTQYLSHLICKSRQCILINIGSAPFKLKLNLQPEQGEKNDLWLCVKPVRAGGSWRAQPGPAVPTAQRGHTRGTSAPTEHQPSRAELQVPSERQMEKHFCKHTLNRSRLDTALAVQLGSSKRGFQETGHFVSSEIFHLLQPAHLLCGITLSTNLV